jgi:hypothetical protein
MPIPWSRQEVEATVDSYFTMLACELTESSYSKAAHRHQLMSYLPGRSEAAIEFKHQNITAVLMELGSPHIPGYKPMRNYQQLLLDVVREHLALDSSFDEQALAAVEREAVKKRASEFTGIMVDPPRLEARVGEQRDTLHNRIPIKRNYLEIEARNRSLGRAGEEFVLDYEIRRLHGAGQKALSEKVEHVASSRGDGLGYDILSYELSGVERYIEVKTTAFGMYSPFFISSSEVAFSDAEAKRYHLYRVFNFRQAPRMFDLRGALKGACHLDAVTYYARFR